MDLAERWPRSVGGNVALDFVNTDLFSQTDRSTDVLRSAKEFLAWCAHAGIASASSAPAGRSRTQDQAFLREAVDVRSAIRILVEAIAGQQDIDRDALITLRSAYADAVGRAAPTLDGGRLSWAWEPTSPRNVLSELVGAAVDLLRHGAVDRIKACPSCGFVFLDTTRNGSRRWCSMEDCGGQEKMRRYVTKRAETRTRSQVGMGERAAQVDAPPSIR
jgi:predicted RNA-binding Zn ribbon-like protein